MSEYILIGKIVSAQAIKGLVNVMSFAQNPVDIAEYGQLFDKDGNQFPKIKIIGEVKGANHDVVTVRVDGVNDRTQAENLQNTELFIDKSQLPEVEEDEFYYVDLIGLEVLGVNKNKIGIIKDVNDFGAGGILEIEFNNKTKEMFSFTDPLFPEVNIKEGYVILDAPGFVDGEPKS